MKSRDCPRCWQPLTEEKRAARGPAVKVDACTKCDGEFLDRGEILRLTGKRDLHALLTKYVTHAAKSDLVCPACGHMMDAEKLHLGEEAVEVDVCMACHGVWLDDGELAKIRSSNVRFDELSAEKISEVFDAQQAARRSGTGVGRKEQLMGAVGIIALLAMLRRIR